MKKSLLIAVAALFLALGANAQIRLHAASPETVTKVIPTTVQMTSFSSLPSYVPSVKKHMKKAPVKAEGGLAGTYILDYYNWEGDFVTSLQFDLIEETGTITLDADLYEEELSFDYNVKLVGFTNEEAVVYGEYDAEAGEIFIPIQTIINNPSGYTTNLGRVILTSATTPDDEGLSYGYPITLSIGDDGKMEFSGETDENVPLAGFYSFLIDYQKTSEGGYYYLDCGFDANVLKPNATMSYSTTGVAFGNSGSGSWEDVEKRVYVEDWGTEYIIHNFLGMAPISVTIVDDQKCKIVYGQEIEEYDFSNNKNYKAVGRMRLVGTSWTDTGIQRDYDVECLNGFHDSELGLWFYRLVEDPETGGHHIEQDHTSQEYCPYFTVATDPSGADILSYGFLFGIDFIYDDSEGTGINNMQIVPETAKSTTLYDLQGRVVDGSYKGIVISNGKKMVVK